jgi:hypothetical protein|nr:MAG TPA: hypothetical protein [Caudoviricetes sp.]
MILKNKKEDSDKMSRKERWEKISKWLHNVGKSSRQVFADWLGQQGFFQFVGDSLQEVKDIKKENERERRLDAKRSPDQKTIKAKLSRWTKKRFDNFFEEYKEEYGEEFKSQVLESFKKFKEAITTGNFADEDPFADLFEDEEDLDVLFDSLDDDLEGETVGESFYIYENGGKMNLREIKDEAIKKIKIMCSAESMDAAHPVPELNTQISNVKNDIVQLDIHTQDKPSDIFADGKFEKSYFTIKNEIKRLVATVNRSGDKLEENYMDSLADNIIALFALKASHKAKDLYLNDCDEVKEDIKKDHYEVKELSERVGDAVEDKVGDIIEGLDKAKDNLVYNPPVDENSPEATSVPDKDIVLKDRVPAGEKTSGEAGFDVEDLQDMANLGKSITGVGSLVDVAATLIAVPINLLNGNANLNNERKYGSNLVLKQPMVVSDAISTTFATKYAKALEVKNLLETKAILESTMAQTDGGSIVSRMAKTQKILSPMSKDLKAAAKLYGKSELSYEEVLAAFSESGASKYMRPHNSEYLYIIPSFTSVVRRHPEDYELISKIDCAVGAGEAGQFIQHGRDALPSYIEVVIEYKDNDNVTRLDQKIQSRKTLLGLSIAPRSLPTEDIMKTIIELNKRALENVTVLREERSFIKKLKNIVTFWKKKGTDAEKKVLKSNSFSKIINKIEGVKSPLFHIAISFGEYVEMKNKGLDLMKKEDYKRVVDQLPVISVSIIDEDSDFVYISEGMVMNYAKYKADDFISAISSYEKDLQTIIKYKQHV